MRWWLLVVVCACGRIAFDPVSERDGDAGTTGSGDGGGGTGSFQFV